VVGGNGFIGANLSRALVRCYGSEEVGIVSRTRPLFDVSKYFPAEQFLSGNVEEVFDYIFVLWSTVLPTTSLDERELLQEVQNLSKLIRLCAERCTTSLIYTSSGGAIYGTQAHVPISENALLYPTSSYGLVKLFGEQLVARESERTGVSGCSLRISNPYGPGQVATRGIGVVDRFIRAAINLETAMVFGDPAQTFRDFIFISDVVKSMTVAAEKCLTGTYNLGSGIATSLLSLIDLIEISTGKSLSLSVESSRPFDPKSNQLDIEKFTSLAGPANFVSLPEGIELTVEAYSSSTNHGERRTKNM
jgi:UDP-glucose 4-epimerase